LLDNREASMAAVLEREPRGCALMQKICVGG